MSKRKRIFPKAVKSNKNKVTTFGKMLDEYFSKINSFGEIDPRERYDVFYKNKWLGRVYYENKKG
ncbi:hypothetical protein UFOVP53_103 [uncultured Caudovirales phage]|uniref:Uncharacterized protein n=1 Tax=uncultured Caudovirales phage TaxID=2100421 RepID=A0A6J5KS68_9CAUD|nr:hypothetical protein UFOVP53_103 [uncultured Caudovirales phage]